MQVDITDLSSLEKMVKVNIPFKQVEAELDIAYKELKKNVRVKGFRPGKVPRKILENYYKDKVEEDIIKKLIDDTYNKILEENSLKPISRPIIDLGKLEQGKDFSYSVKFEVRPVVSPQNYSGLELIKEKVEETNEEEVTERLKELQEANCQLKEVDRAVMKSDVVIIDFQAFCEDKIIAEEKGTNYTFELGKGRSLEDFEEGLAGMNKGETKKIVVNFPSDAVNKNLAGKEISYEVHLKEIKEKIIPELDDEFARDLGTEYKTLEDLKNHIKNIITEQKKSKTEIKLRNDIIEKLIENNPFEVSPSLVETQVQLMINEAEQNFKQQGLSFTQAGIDPMELKKKYLPEAERRVRGALILESIAEKENIDVEDGEIEKRIEKIASQTGQSLDYLKAFYTKKENLDNLTGQLREEKILDFLVSKANVIENN
ncbi:MAG: trigger factor [Thermodesulfobacteriota bacterium]|nr:trigger factor [Thermodesulfobacteriota bacterium]